MTRRDAEVIVVGGGPAGSATAFFLARAGVEVILVDRARFPRDKPCAEYLSPQASRLLDEMGALHLVESAGAAQLTGMRITAPDGTSFLGEFAAGHGFRPFRDRGLALRRTVLDALLLDRARAAGVQVREGCPVRDLHRDGGRVVGVATDRDGAAITLRAALTIGADGLRSVVARRLGLARRGRWPRRIALVSHYRGVAGIGPHGEMHVFPDGYVGLADVGGGLTNVSVVIPARLAPQIGGAPDAYSATWLAARPALAPRLAGAQRVTDVRVTGPFNSRARRSWADGAALVGDAADFHDPFTGEGIYAALRGAELLTPYAFDAVRSTGARQHRVALEAYERARRDDFGGKWRFERLVGTAVGVPRLMNRAARALARRRDMADLMVGTAGDFVPARQVLGARFLLELVLASGARSASPVERRPTSHPA